MKKQPPLDEQPSQPTSIAQPLAKPKRDSRSETIALAMERAASPAGRARARESIQDCGSPVIAAKEVFLAYAEAAEQTDPRYTVACHSGCWFCCTIPVAVTVFEAAMVRSAVHSLPETQQQAIWARLEEHIDLQDQALADADRQHIAFHHRCPLLTDQGQCSVYQGRPLACRSLLSLDAERCRRTFLEDDRGDPSIAFTLTNNAAISGIPELMITLNEGRLDHYPNYELASALYVLWKDPDRFVAWQQGALFAQEGFPRMAEDGQIYPAPQGLPIGPPD
ncbi:MAG TPA: YkgJ family cysteine cluster protein [Roseiflexaceae bacterium]|nr:YkgJ family cysteine cluster protein [Roseiflexaceae bacterium]